MNGGENFETFIEDPRITTIAVDSLNGKIFWITGKDILMRKLNGLVMDRCVSGESEPLALTLDVERQYLYWMTFKNEDNTVWLNQLAYTTEQCDESHSRMMLPGSLFASSSRGVLSYGLGALYLTTISSSSQSVYVLPADFASTISGNVEVAFGVIPQTDVVRDIRVVSEMLQPLPDGLTVPGLASLTAEPLNSAPRLDKDQSNTSVIVIEWGESPTDIGKPILYEVEYTLTPFRQPSMEPKKEFTTDTFIQLDDQTPFTEVMVTVTPHTLWLQSDQSLSLRSVFTSTPTEPGRVMNVRVYVYRPLLEDDSSITALIVWDALSDTEAGGIVNYYRVSISGAKNLVLDTVGNESYLIVRQFVTRAVSGVLSYPLERSRTYHVEVSAINDGGAGEASDSVTFLTDSVSPPQPIIAVNDVETVMSGDNGVVRSYTAVDPVSVNTISRLMYWYNMTLNSILVQSLDGDEISVFLKESPVNLTTMAFEWQGERLYMAGFNSTTSQYEIWRAPVVYSKELEIVYELPESVQLVSNLVVDSFRRGGAYWIQKVGDDMSLEFLNLDSTSSPQETVNFTGVSVSAMTLEPLTGELWVLNKTNGRILRCSRVTESCEDVVAAGIGTSSIAMDENKIYWTDGTTIFWADRADPSNPSTLSDENPVISLHTLSPGNQPQFYSCESLTTCLAPDLIVEFRRTLPRTNTTAVTNTSIEVWWSFPLLRPCCYETVFSYPLAKYNYGFSFAQSRNPESFFQRHLSETGLEPFRRYPIYLSIYNIYTLTNFGTIPLGPWFIGAEAIITRPGVPDPVDTLSVASGVTCVSVSWSGPTDLNGPDESRTYFLSYSNSSFDATLDVGSSRSQLLNVTPGVNYTIELRVSNQKFNSSVVAEEGVQSWSLAPTPVLNTLSNTSMTLMLELEVIHMHITEVYIKAEASEGDVDGNSSNQDMYSISTLPVTLYFNLSGLSAYTLYEITVIATYNESECGTNTYAGEPQLIQTKRK
jgi:hypothetical protein